MRLFPPVRSTRSTKGTKVLMSVPDWASKLFGTIEMCQSLTKGCTACIEQGYRYIVEFTNEFENRIFWNNSRLGIAIIISIWIIFNRNLLEPMYLKRKLWNLNFVRIAKITIISIVKSVRYRKQYCIERPVQFLGIALWI